MKTWNINSSTVLMAMPLALVATAGSVTGQEDVDHAAASASARQQTHQALAARFEAQLTSRVRQLDQRHGLSEAQRRKLLIAGGADIRRFLDRAEEAAREIDLADADRIERWGQFDEMARGHLNPNQDLFDEGSLFAKVIGNTLTKEQAARHRAIELELLAQRHRATLEWVLRTWEQTLKLSADQRRRLDALLQEQTRAPRKSGEYDYFGVLLQLSRIPERTLKTHFSDAQWIALSKHMMAAKDLEATLKQRGYLPGDEVAALPGGDHRPEVKTEKGRG